MGVHNIDRLGSGSMGTWFSKVFSVEESKVSTMIICLIGTLAFACVVYVQTGEFNPNITNVIIALIAGVSTVNISSNFNVNASNINQNNTTDNGYTNYSTYDSGFNMSANYGYNQSYNQSQEYNTQINDTTQYEDNR